MDYLALPPEINSARIYAGPGAAPLMAASTAWSSLAAELGQAAVDYSSTIMGLDAAWVGPSSVAMTAGSASYIQWLTMSAGQAAQTAMQAQMAAAAYEAAWAGSVPPPIIAANRSLLMTLVATNFLGINTPAIMATEAHYMEMWAQDVAAMMAYQVASMAATAALSPFVPAAPNTNPGGIGAQAASVTIASATSAGTGQGTVAGISSLLNPNGIPIFGLDNSSLLGQYLQSIVQSGEFTSVPIGIVQTLLSAQGNQIAVGTPNFPSTPTAPTNTAGVSGEASGSSPLASSGAGTSAGVSPVSAGMGQAGKTGYLSVPPGWSQQAGQNRLSSSVTPLSETAEGAAPRMGPVASGIPTAIGTVSASGGRKRQGAEILTKAQFVANKGL